MLRYIKYFFYLAFNWNPKIAWTIIQEEKKGEKKYGICTTGADELKSLDKKGVDISHATIYMPVHYPLLEEAFTHLTISSPIHFLDIGCGKGRALCVAAHNGFNTLTGVEFSKELCDSAKTNMELTKQLLPSLTYELVNNDAFYYEIPDTVNCIFMFNPFDEVIMSGVAENIHTSLNEKPRPINIIYINPLHREYLDKLGFKEVWHYKSMNYLEAIILEKK